MPLDKVLYTAKTQTTGGRDGASHSDDGRLAVKLSSPGTPGSGTNPEQLFAADWSACFLSSIRLDVTITLVLTRTRIAAAPLPLAP